MTPRDENGQLIEPEGWDEEPGAVETLPQTNDEPNF